jgi:hypothetical protein
MSPEPDTLRAHDGLPLPIREPLIDYHYPRDELNLSEMSAHVFKQP